MADIHPNFKKGYDNMMELAKTKKFKKTYGQAVGKAKAKSDALKSKMNHKRVEDKHDTDHFFGDGTFTKNRSIAKHYEKLGVPHQGRK